MTHLCRAPSLRWARRNLALVPCNKHRRSHLDKPMLRGRSPTGRKSSAVCINLLTRKNSIRLWLIHSRKTLEIIHKASLITVSTASRIAQRHLELNLTSNLSYLRWKTRSQPFTLVSSRYPFTKGPPWQVKDIFLRITNWARWTKRDFQTIDLPPITLHFRNSQAQRNQSRRAPKSSSSASLTE